MNDTEFKEHVDHIAALNEEYAWKLYHWRYLNGGNFSDELFTLIAKADSEDIERIRAGFPDHVFTFQYWQTSRSSAQFFKPFGFPEPGMGWD